MYVQTHERQCEEKRVREEKETKTQRLELQGEPVHAVHSCHGGLVEPVQGSPIRPVKILILSPPTAGM